MEEIQEKAIEKVWHKWKKENQEYYKYFKQELTEAEQERFYNFERVVGIEDEGFSHRFFSYHSPLDKGVAVGININPLYVLILPLALIIGDPLK